MHNVRELQDAVKAVYYAARAARAPKITDSHCYDIAMTQYEQSTEGNSRRELQSSQQRSGPVIVLAQLT